MFPKCSSVNQRILGRAARQQHPAFPDPGSGYPPRHRASGGGKIRGFAPRAGKASKRLHDYGADPRSEPPCPCYPHSSPERQGCNRNPYLFFGIIVHRQGHPVIGSVAGGDPRYAVVP
jgi:hypothetical protein